jgi:hypothetical protein
VPRTIGEIEQEDVALKSEILEADALLSAPFAHSEALAEARQRQRSVNDALAAQQAEKDSEKRAEPAPPVRRSGPGPEVPGNRAHQPTTASTHEVGWQPTSQWM